MRTITSRWQFMIGAALIVIAQSLLADTAEFDPSQPLPEGSGLLLFGTHSPNPAVSIRFKSGMKSFKTSEFPAGHQYKLLILPEGEYSVESLYVQGIKYTMLNKSYFKGWSFEVRGGKLNYMGEAVLDGNDIQRWVNTETAAKVLDRLFPEAAKQFDVTYTGEDLQ